VRLDVGSPASITECVQQTLDQFGRLDILVNNVATLIPHPIEEPPLELAQPSQIDSIWEIDLRGALLLMRDALPHLKGAGGGYIINISSIGALFPRPGPYAELVPFFSVGSFRVPRAGHFYSMCKTGLERFSQGLAMEVQAYNIAVNVLSPKTWYRTPGNMWAGNDPENPNVEFEPADKMGLAAAWICEQPPQQYTGNIAYEEDICAEHALS
jgi:3-oxoacyl-[acyl-carrier protein] reductase